MADVEKYLELITAFHRGKPKFSAMVEAVARCFVGAQDSFGQMVPAYDLDDAVGVQLDAIGEWVGISRNVRTPLEGVYFSFDVSGLGFEQGVWQGPFDPDTGVTSLDDETYRVLIRAKIGANHWDGTLESSAAILNSIFSAGTSPIPVNANAEPFGTGDGAATQFQLKYQGRPVFQVGSATIFRNDWQGNQWLYPTPRTNLVSRSFATPSGWGAAAGSVLTPNYATAPDGSKNAGFLGTSTPLVAYAFPGTSSSQSYTAGVRYTASVWFKRDPAMSSKQVRLLLHSAAFGFHKEVYFNVQTGAVVGGANSPPQGFGSTIYPDGWTRVWVSDTASVTTNSYPPLVWFNGNIVPGEGVAFWGMQLETGPTQTAYIETNGSSVTVTDYSASPTGLITMGQVPAIGAALTWTGDGQIYPAGTYVFIQDNGDMSIDIGIAGERPSAVFLALLTGGYIPIKPEGVRVNYYIVPGVEGPLFGFDVGNQYISGLDVGVWGDLIQP